MLHNAMLKYVPKRIHFRYTGMVARTALAVIDHNFNCGRKQSKTLDGVLRWKVQWSKSSKSFVVKKINEKKSLTFHEDLTQASVQRLRDRKL